MRIEEIRSGLCARLRARRTEIEQAAFTRVYAVSDSGLPADPEYTEGLRATVVAALEYGIEALERSEDRAPPMPTTLLSQARLAARNGVRLDVVLRRYLAGYTLLGDFVIEEAGKGGSRATPRSSGCCERRPLYLTGCSPRPARNTSVRLGDRDRARSEGPSG